MSALTAVFAIEQHSCCLESFLDESVPYCSLQLPLFAIPALCYGFCVMVGVCRQQQDPELQAGSRPAQGQLLLQQALQAVPCHRPFPLPVL